MICLETRQRLVRNRSASRKLRMVQVVGYSKNEFGTGFQRIDASRTLYSEVLQTVNWVDGVGGMYHWHSHNMYYYWDGFIGPPFDDDTLRPLSAENPDLSMENGTENATMEYGTDNKTVYAQTALKTGKLTGPGQMNLYLIKVLMLKANGKAVDPARVRVPGWTLTPSADDPGFGNFLVWAPGGATIGMTAQAGVSYDYFGFLVNNVTLQIIDPNSGVDLTLQTNTVIVGQQMNLRCQLSVTMTNVTPTNFQWTVPGYAISNYVANGSSGIVYTNFPLNNSNVVFYWVDGATNRTILCSATVNGQKITAQATFNVLRPDVTWTLTPKDSVAVDTNYADPPPGYYGGYYFLRTGKDYTTNDYGMLYSFQVTDLKGYTGSYDLGCCQIITVDWKRNLELPDGSSYSKSLTGKGLDVVMFVPWDAFTGFSLYGQVISGYTHDSPADPLDNPISFDWRGDSFEEYLIFTPAGGKPVPLKLATWNWYGTAKRMSTNTPPTFVGGGVFTNQQAAIGRDCFIYPQWTNNVVNIQQNNWELHSTEYPTP